MIISEPALGSATGTGYADYEDAGLTVECFEDAVPPFVEAALQQLYGNLFSTLAHRRVYGSAANLNTFVVRSASSIVTVWLFEREARSVRVLNEGIEVNAAEVMRFVRHVFDAYPRVGRVVFHAVQLQLRHLPLPCQRYNCLEDMVLKLPSSATEYLAHMGKSTRSYIHRYMNKLRRDFPSVRFELVEAHEIDERHIRHIIDLNRARMAHKGKVSINDATLAEQIAHLAMDCGLVGALTINGRVVAGTINYRVRDNYFLEVIAHDPAYDEYRLGTLCCYLTVCECIARAGNEYHFLWGQDEYKSRLLGKRRELDDLVVYRSRAQLLLQAGSVLRHEWKARRRRLQLRTRAARQESGALARVLNVLMAIRRRLRFL